MVVSHSLLLRERSIAPPAALLSARSSFPVTRSKTYKNACFVGWDGLWLPIDRDVGKNGRTDIPDAMMDELIVPFALAGMKVDCNQALAE